MQLIDTERLEELIRSSIEILCRYFFSAGRKEGREWKIGDVTGVAGNSLGIQLTGDKAGVWHDRATGQGGNFTKLIMENRGVHFPATADMIGNCLGVNVRVGQADNSTFNWGRCVRDLSSEQIGWVAAERGVKEPTIQWLADRNWFGSYYVLKWCAHCIAFPIQGDNGEVVRAHCRSPQRNQKGKWGWTYEPFDPQKRPVSALLFGTLEKVHTVYIFESQWDAIALIDKLEFCDQIDSGEVCIICTRGSKIAKRLFELPWKQGPVIYAFPQNDQPDGKGIVASQEWLKYVLAATGGCYVVRIPQEHKDLNDWTRAGAIPTDLEGAIDHAQFEKPQTDFRTEVSPTDNDNELPSLFPLSAFPPIVQKIIGEVCQAELVPASLVGCAALGIASASVGAGISIQSGSSRLTRGNTHLMAIAESGIGKWSSFRHIAKPFYAREEALIVQWRREIFPGIAAEIDVLEATYKRIKESAAKAKDEHEKLGLLEELTQIKKRIEELREKSLEPCLSVGDATKEAMAVAMGNQIGEALASISSEGRGIIDVLCGRYSNGASDEDFYTAGYTGDPVKVNRISRPAIYLKAPCLTVFWMLQPDKIRTILEKSNLTESGMLQRFLVCNTRAEPQEEPSEAYVINPDVFSEWDLCIAELIKNYRLRRDPVLIEPTPEARELFRAFTNEIVRRRRHGGDLADVQTYAARWAEQAWRLAVGWQALNVGAQAHLRAFDATSAGNVIQIARWFAQEQMLMLGMLRTERRNQRFEKLYQILERLPGRHSTLNDLKRRNGFEEEEVRSLADEFYHKLEIKILKPTTGRPSTFAALK
jgi:hypothetical protein